MELIISNEITIKDPTTEVREWVYSRLKVANPEYSKKVRLGLWIGNTPKEIALYRNSGSDLIIPHGVKDSLLYAFPELNINGSFEHPVLFNYASNKPVNYNANINLYDYQKDALNSLVRSRGGILQSKAGSGKTRVDIALACALGRKTLWLTHTNEL